MKSITLAITAGDYNGIGPEIIIKSFADKETANLCDFIIFGSEEIFKRTFDRFSSTLQSRYQAGYTSVIENLYSGTASLTLQKSDFTPGASSKKSGQAARRFLSEAIDCCKRGECGGIVTAPIAKSTFFLTGERFNGQTEWIAHSIGSSQSLMIMVKDLVRIALVTTHIALREIPDCLTVELVSEKGSLLYQSLVQDFGIKKPRIALCGLNPHCGEEGRFGGEERTILEPALDTLRKSGGEWVGPLPADTLFEKRFILQYNAILALYHDQGLIPFKVYCGFTGVNFTAGLPLVRTSPDHGVALNIAGKIQADARGFKEAITLAAQVASRRAGRTGSD